MYEANLAAILNYDEGRTNAEIETDLFTVFLDQRETAHYARDRGGNFRDLEQAPYSQATMFLIYMFFIESVYMLNENRNFDPFVVVGYSDIQQYDDDGQPVIKVNYRLLQNIEISGSLNTGLLK